MHFYCIFSVSFFYYSIFFSSLTLCSWILSVLFKASDKLLSGEEVFIFDNAIRLAVSSYEGFPLYSIITAVGDDVLCIGPLLSTDDGSTTLSFYFIQFRKCFEKFMSKTLQSNKRYMCATQWSKTSKITSKIVKMSIFRFFIYSKPTKR